MKTKGEEEKKKKQTIK